MMGQAQLHLLHKEGILSVENDTLQNIRKHYRRGEKGIIIFEPPKVGSDILLLRHYVSSRDSINTRFTNEQGFEKEWTIYHVENPILVSDEYNNPFNRAVLTYKIMKGPYRKRLVEFRDFFSGFYYPRELTEEEKQIVRGYRKLVDETFSIRIV